MNHHLALLPLFCVACLGSDTDLETAFCNGLEEAAARTVSASAGPEDAPDVTDVGRVDIELLAGDSAGFVAYVPDEVGSFAFGLTEDLPIAIRDADGAAVEIEQTVTGSMLCDALAVRYSAPLTIQRYTLEVGPTSATTLGIIAEESDDDL